MNTRTLLTVTGCLIAFTAFGTVSSPSHALGPLRALLHGSHSKSAKADDGDGYGSFFNNLSCEKMVKLAGRSAHRDVAPIPATYTGPYGNDPLQTMDIYAPAQAKPHPAPVIVMVHGGAWCVGDKIDSKIVLHKTKRWLARDFVFVSINYRMLPDHADVMTQAADVASAIAYVQAHAAQWGGNPAQIILMGHSAGAHLVSLLGSDPKLAAKYGARPWLGTVSLDSAALDVPASMRAQHPAFYDDAFGSDPSVWTAASPLQHLSPSSLPWLGVCSTQRKDSCPHAHAFAKRAQEYGVKASVLEENLKHSEINDRLGEDGVYTETVESFMATLSPDVAQRLR